MVAKKTTKSSKAAPKKPARRVEMVHSLDRPGRMVHPGEWQVREAIALNREADLVVVPMAGYILRVESGKTFVFLSAEKLFSHIREILKASQAIRFSVEPFTNREV